MFKIIEYNRDRKPLKDYNEYIANTFEELPTADQGAMLGDRGYYKDGETIGIAMYFDSGWLKG